MGNEICSGCKTGSELVDTMAAARLQTICQLTESAMALADKVDRIANIADSDSGTDEESSRVRSVAANTRISLGAVVNDLPDVEVVCSGANMLGRLCGAKVVELSR